MEESGHILFEVNTQYLYGEFINLYTDVFTNKDKNMNQKKKCIFNFRILKVVNAQFTIFLNLAPLSWVDRLISIWNESATAIFSRRSAGIEDGGSSLGLSATRRHTAHDFIIDLYFTKFACLVPY